MRGTSISRQVTAVAVLVALAVLASPARPARACGGFFCDRPPPDGSLPIAQAGENVLFVLGKDPQTGQGTVEAHIQIVYEGAADQFSWVVPVTALPTLDVGSDALFDRLEPATRPSFKPQWQMDGTCQGFGGGNSGVGCGSSSSPKAGRASESSSAGIEGPAVEVVFRGNVGPYDSAVIRSDDPLALKTWLATNGYYVSDASAQIVDDYVAAHSYFVALRLRQGQDTSAIQPIVVRMASPEGCLPLKLTAIASTPDLRVNVWVLGDARAVPLDYVEIGVNQAKLDWFKFGANYDRLLGEAANEAGGNAFAVEYAKPSATLAAQFAISPSQIDQLAHATDPSTYLAQLKALGLAPTGLLLAVLRKHLPLPSSLAAQGVTEAQFYGDPYRYLFGAVSLDVPFDAPATTAELQTTFFAPLAALQPLFSSHRYLTRFATFISPEEMTKDPRFVTNAELPDVEPQHLAVAHMLCGDQEYDVCHVPVRLRLEDGTDVMFAVAADAPAACDAQKTPSYDRSGVDKLPSSDIGWLRDAEGEGHKVVDNRSAITAGLARQNASVPVSSGGCGCSVRGRARPVAAALALLVVLVARRRRRR
jgi:MYXO-CTERM domain-containing protein